MASEDVLKEGYLVKSPDSAKNLLVFKKWQRKWFRLCHNGDLLVFDSEKSSKATQTIPLLQCYRLFDARTKGIDLNYCVGLEVGDHTHYFKAENADIYNHWIPLFSGFAEVVEAPRQVTSRGSPKRRGTTTSDQLRDDDDEEMYRSASVVSRHLSPSVKAKFNKKEGWLAKTGSNNRGWRDRYFVLSHGKLSYFKNESTDNSQGSIDLFECTAVSNSTGKKGFGFKIELPGRMYNISAESRRDMEEWIMAINHSLTIISELKTPTRSSSIGSAHSGTLDRSHSPSPSPKVTHLTTFDQGSSDAATRTSYPGHREDRDVVQLLEAEVEALRSKVHQLESELQSSTLANNQLQNQLAHTKSQRDGENKQLTKEKEELQAQLIRQQGFKEELEKVNDSLHIQLEEHMDRVQLMEEEEVSLKQELEEAHSALTAAEEDARMMQSELVATQQQLKEVEAAARDLEITLAEKAKQSSDLAAKEELETLEASEMLEMDQERDSPPQDSRMRRRTVGSRAKSETALVSRSTADVQLDEQRLKWQMEMENLRQECDVKVAGVTEAFIQERAELEERISSLEEECEKLRLALKEKTTEVRSSLDQAEERISVLQSQLSSEQEKNGQLQMEKDKAVADLISIRKLNKKLTETEVSNVNISPSTSPDIEALPHGVTDSEENIEELRSELLKMQLERDQLKAEIQRMLAGTPNGVMEAEVNLRDANKFAFKSKSRATVACSSQSPSAPSRSTRTQSFRDSVQQGIQNSNRMREDAPPPKPQRPPQELLNRYYPQSTHSRARTGSFLQSLFGSQ